MLCITLKDHQRFADYLAPNVKRKPHKDFRTISFKFFDLKEEISNAFKAVSYTHQLKRYQGVKNFTLVTRYLTLNYCLSIFIIASRPTWLPLNLHCCLSTFD